MSSVPKGNERSLSRLGHGEYAGREYVVGRQGFLDALVELDGPALLDLERWARHLAAEVPATTIPRYDSSARQWVENPRQPRLLDETMPLDAEILRWLKRKRLREDWVEAAVLWTLRWWATAIIENQEWTPGIYATPVKDDYGVYFRPEGVVWANRKQLDPDNPAVGRIDLEYHLWFHLQAHTRAAIKASIMEATEEEVDRQLNDVERACKAAGLANPDTKRNDSRQHFRWLVRYQVLSESYGNICKAPGEGRKAIDRHSVKEAVKKTAASIGLRLRDPDPPGRPVGS